MEKWKIIAVTLAVAVATILTISAGLIMPLYSSLPKNPCSESSPSSSMISERLMDIAYQTPNERFDDAALVVIGRVIDSTARCDGPQIMTYMEVEVEESLKNPENIRTLTTKTFGGKIGDYGIWIEDSPIFNKGDRAFLYLYKDKPMDDVFMISPYSGALVQNDSPDYSILGKEILETFRLQFITSGNSSSIDILRGTSKEVSLRLDSFFGYNLPTNLTVSSFARYTDQGIYNTVNLTALNDFGLSIEPASTVVTPSPNGTSQATFSIIASKHADLGVYDIFVSSTTEDRYSYLAGGNTETYVRINITDSSNHDASLYNDSISINIEKYGRREFYQDENAGMPTNLTISDAGAFSKDAIILWPSIGPNYIITSNATSTGDEMIVFDYYKSLGLNENMSNLQYDEFARSRELQPPPAIAGRTFGFEWDQINLEGARVEPGRYQVSLIMPVMIEESDHKEILTLTSNRESFTIFEGKPRSVAHNLILEYNVNNTNLLTGEPYRFSLYLVNYGNNSESFTVDHNSEEGSCYWKNTLKLEHPDHILPHGGKVNLAPENNVGGAPGSPGVYPYAPFVMLSIDEPDRVECLKVEANTVILNVTAPVYEYIKLVITSDKQVYQQNETITVSLYIENNSDEPFKLQEIVPSISIKDNSGRQVYGFSWVADYSIYPTVAPHSRYILTNTIPANWDQTVFLEDGSTALADPGEYLLQATFTYPYLESDVHKIIIE